MKSGVRIEHLLESRPKCRTSDATQIAHRDESENESGRRRSRRRLQHKGALMATRRTTLRSRSGKKLYAVRDASGKFKDIQSYKRAHAADLKRSSKAETGAKETLAAMEKKVEKVAKKAVRTVRARLAESGAKDKLMAVERKVQRAAKKAAGNVRTKLAEVRADKRVVAMERKVERAAKKAARSVQASLTDAMAAVKRAANKVARRVSSAKPAAKKTARKAPARRATRKA
jgi:hypothetical protein